MSSHALAIAKASLAATMMRPDPTPVSRSEVAQLDIYIEALLKHCSRKNIQQCREWIVRNVVPSKARHLAFGKLLAITTQLLTNTSGQEDAKKSKDRTPPLRRRQLHVLYLLNDVHHHLRYHCLQTTSIESFAENVQPFVGEIVCSASTHPSERFPRHQQKIQDIVDLWAKLGYYDVSSTQKLRDIAVSAAQNGQIIVNESDPRNGNEDSSGQNKKDAPYIMPASHGDASTPFYDLPAGNMMPLIIPNSTVPIDPQSMRPLQFSAGPADPKLAASVQDFLVDIDSMDKADFAQIEIGLRDIDDLGQFVSKNGITPEKLHGEGYYGWSRAFCEKMKGGESIRGFEPGERASVSVTESGSQSPRKRRRYSSSRSPSTDGRGRSSSPTFSRSPRRERFSPPVNPSHARQILQPSTHAQSSNSQGMDSQAYTLNPPPPPPPPFMQGFPVGPGGIAIPPRTAGYHGPWPPPPPPPPQAGAPDIPNLPFPLLGSQLQPQQGIWAHQIPAAKTAPWESQIHPSPQNPSSVLGMPSAQSQYMSSGNGQGGGHGGWPG